MPLIVKRPIFWLKQDTGDCPIARPPFIPRKPVQDGPRLNDQIRVPKIRLIDADGEMVGVVTPAEGLRMAEEAGLDLVEVSPNAEPPVCKILDHGKYKYEMQKKANEARKKQKTVDVKEVKMRPGIEEHDYAVKLRNAQRFLEEGNKVKVTLRFRGREMAHQDLALSVMRRFRDDLAQYSKVDQEAKMEGRQAVMMLSSDIKAPPPKDDGTPDQAGE